MSEERLLTTKTEATEELNRLLEIGRLLVAVLTPEEVEQLHVLIGRKSSDTELFALIAKMEIGNTSVT